jgi:hypothetical protein
LFPAIVTEHPELPEHPPSQLTRTASDPGVAVSVTTDRGSKTELHCVPQSTPRGALVTVPVAVRLTVRSGMRIRFKLSPLRRSWSTHPVIPGTDPQLDHCHTVQPCPAQFPPGTVGVPVVQCANQSG